MRLASVRSAGTVPPEEQADQVKAELAAVKERIVKEKQIQWDETKIEVCLHIGTDPGHKISKPRAEALRGELPNYGTVGTETQGESVSIDVPK